MALSNLLAPLADVAGLPPIPGVTPTNSVFVLIQISVIQPHELLLLGL
jgi:hypothetical protein